MRARTQNRPIGPDDLPGRKSAGRSCRSRAKATREASFGICHHLRCGRASESAGLPLGEKLKTKLLHRFGGELDDVLMAEARAAHGDRAGSDQQNVDSLSLFELAALLSHIAYCREIVTKTLSEEIGPAKTRGRPLAYELLAHPPTHRFIGHFIASNVDELLDEAVDEELPEWAVVIASPRDVPIGDELNDNKCYLVHSLGRSQRRP